MVLEPARQKELAVCMEIIGDGRRFQNEQGFVQWTDDYPDEETIRNDIKNKTGYLLKTGEGAAGYLCIDFAGEPDYADIRGEWRTAEPYAVVHRLAFRREFRGMGLSNAAFAQTERLCAENGIRSIRVDTDMQNRRMRHILEKNGFVCCGMISFRGTAKLAFDKQLPTAD